MALACIALIIPAAFVSSLKLDDHNENLLYLSYGTAMVLLIIYILFLVFQVSTIYYK
jgi:Ca2+:H+ antiporter